MARTNGALGRDNPEYIKKLENEKAAIEAKIKAAKELRASKLAAKLLKSDKTDQEIDEFLSK